MASKLALTAALLVALVAFAFASATTYTTTSIDDEANPQQQQQCQLQGRQFLSCQRYLSQRSSQYDGEEGKSLLEMSTDDNPEQQSQYLRDCCQQLRNVNEQCRCEAIKHAVRQKQQHQQGGSQQGQQVQQVYQKAKNLPQRGQFQRPQQ